MNLLVQDVQTVDGDLRSRGIELYTNIALLPLNQRCDESAVTGNGVEFITAGVPRQNRQVNRLPQIAAGTAAKAPLFASGAGMG